MEYRYNAEVNRIKSIAWNPCFMKATYEDTMTGADRIMYLYSCCDNNKRLQSVAASFAKETENVVSLQRISRREYEAWLGLVTPERNGIEIYGTQIPADYVLDYLICENAPKSSNPNIRTGDLRSEKVLIENKDIRLMEDIAYSYEQSQPAYDKVRFAPDVIIDNTKKKESEIEQEYERD